MNIKNTLKAVLALSLVLVNISAHSLVLDPGEEACAVYLDEDDGGEAYLECMRKVKTHF